MLLFYCCCPGYSFSFSSEFKTLFTPSGITCKLLEFFIIKFDSHQHNFTASATGSYIKK